MKKKIKLHYKYHSLQKHTGRYTILTGGRGSGKSFSLATYLIKLSFETDHVIIFARKTAKSLNNSGIPELQEKISAVGLDDYFHVIANEMVNKQSGSVIRFVGLTSNNNGNTAALLKGLTGATCLIIEEAEEFHSEEEFDTINFSIRSKLRPNRVFLVLNPTTKAHWIYKRFFLESGVQPGTNGIRGDVNYIHTTFYDNIEHLSPSYIKELENLKKKNPAKFNNVVLGGWIERHENTIYDSWKIERFPEDVDVFYGADFGFSNDPNTLIKIHLDKRRKKIYLKECLYQPGLVTSQLIEIYQHHCGSSLIVADSAEPRLIAEVKSAGLKIRPCVKGAGSIVEGITLIRDYEMIVDPESINLMNELNNYIWLEKRQIPKDDFNHLLDAMRYAITHYLKGGMSGRHYIA